MVTHETIHEYKITSSFTKTTYLRLLLPQGSCTRRWRKRPHLIFIPVVWFIGDTECNLHSGRICNGCKIQWNPWRHASFPTTRTLHRSYPSWLWIRCIPYQHSTLSHQLKVSLASFRVYILPYRTYMSLLSLTELSGRGSFPCSCSRSFIDTDVRLLDAGVIFMQHYGNNFTLRDNCSVPFLQLGFYAARQFVYSFNLIDEGLKPGHMYCPPL